MKKYILPITLMVLTLSITSCKNKDKDKEDNPVEQTEAIVEVDTMNLKVKTFQKQLLCNGKLAAIRRADLQCSYPGEVLQAVFVRNGQQVGKGSLLCMSDTRDRMVALDKARHDLERAKVELQDKLVSLGYDANTDNVPANVLHKAEIVSGYYTAKYQLQAARKSLAQCELRAPFAGKIANLEARAHQPGNRFATLVDDSYLEVNFKILEAELAFVRKGQNVKITPYVDSRMTYLGTVTDINPMVDDKGMVTITARMKNTSTRLMDGMNVKVIVENAVPNMLVVPKDAVVERDGYHVIFVYDKETRRAVWTYVDILYTNLNSYAITGCAKKETEVHAGMTVITSGNLNLADDTEVRINQDE